MRTSGTFLFWMTIASARTQKISTFETSFVAAVSILSHFLTISYVIKQVCGTSGICQYCHVCHILSNTVADPGFPMGEGCQHCWVGW